MTPWFLGRYVMLNEIFHTANKNVITASLHKYLFLTYINVLQT